MNTITCSIYRGSLIESQHLVEGVVVGPNNKVLFQTKKTNKPYCLRSTLKPFQFAAAIYNGVLNSYPLTSQEISLACASHHGEGNHIKTVKKILKKISLSEKNLECGFHYPLDKTNKSYLHSHQSNKSNIYNNCSGKHSGLLAFIRHMGYPTKNYINHNHPIHNHIIEYIERVAKTRAQEYATDGCSLPTPYFHLTTLAEMYLKLISETTNSELQTVYRAMTKHPEMVAGKSGFDTWFMKVLKGRAVAKGGAEGMRALALDTKEYGPIALALKVQDGNHRASEMACLEILNHIGALTEEEWEKIKKHATHNSTNLNGINVGEIQCTIQTAHSDATV